MAHGSCGGAATQTPIRSGRKGATRRKLTDRDALIEEYQEFVDLMVGRLIKAMRLPVALRDDFAAAGTLGLVEAADRYDPKRGVDFRAFAYFRIRGAIIDYVRSCCELSGHAYRMFKAFEAAHELQAEVLENESAGPGIDSLTHTMEFLSRSAMAYKLAGIKGFATSDLQVDPDGDPEEILQKKRESEKLRAIVATLPEKERTIIEQYYFHDRKFIEVAEHYAGLSKSWVSRLHDRALSMLRDKFLEQEGE